MIICFSRWSLPDRINVSDVIIKGYLNIFFRIYKCTAAMFKNKHGPEIYCYPFESEKYL
jgi:hypothetical protein